MAKNITLTNSDGSTIYYPKTVAEEVYHNSTGQTVAAEISAINADLTAIGPKVDEVKYKYTERDFDGYVTGVRIDQTENVIISVATSVYSYYRKVTAGDIYRITASEESSHAFRYGFTASIPAVGDAVTGAAYLDATSVDVEVTAPIDGYLLVCMSNQFFTDRAIFEKSERIDDIEATLDEVRKDINIDSLTQSNFIFIYSTGLWGTNGNGKHSKIAAEYGDVFIITAQASEYAAVAFVSAYNVVSGGSASIISKAMIPAGTSATLMAPKGTAYLLVNMLYYSGDVLTGNRTPTAIVKDYSKAGTIVNDEISLLSTSLFNNERILSGRYLSSNTWTDDYRYACAIFDVKVGDKISITANAGNNASYNFLGSDLSVLASTATVSAGETLSDIVVPENSAYLYVYYGNTSSTYGYVYKPAAIISATGQVSIEAEKKKESLELIPSTDFVLNKYYIGSSSNLWTVENNEYYYCIVVPIKGGKTYEIGRARGNSSGEYFLRYAFLTSNEVVDGETPSYATGYSATVVSTGGYNVVVTAPSDAKYLYIYIGRASSFNYLPEYIKCIDGSLETAMAILQEEIDKKEDAENVADIVKLNDPTKTVNMLEQMKWWYAKTGNNSSGNAQAIFLHFTDIHGNTTALSRIIDYYKQYKSYLSDVINTGDTCISNPDDIVMSDFYTGDAVKFLTAIGNHDAATQNGDPISYPVAIADVYGEFIAPFVSNWGVTQPTDAATEYKCYYYKDYADSKLRLIVLDEYHYDEAQDTWLADLLADAITNEYHVLMATHSANGSLVNRATTFTDRANGGGYQYGVNIGSETLNAVTRVGDFIDDGGTLVCWLYGHSHYDNVGFSSIDNRQLRIGCSTAAYNKANNYGVARILGTKSQDCFNIVAIDTNLGYIRVFRVGADCDMYLKHRDCFCYNYIDGTLINNANSYIFDDEPTEGSSNPVTSNGVYEAFNNTVAMQVTFEDDTTATYNVVIRQ